MDQFGILTFGSRLKRLSDCLFMEVEALYKRHNIGFSPTNFPVLKQLQSQPGQTVVELAQLLGVSHPAVSKQINKLTGEGWVVKCLDQDDNRRLLISLSEQGLAEMKKVEPILDAIQCVMEREANNIDARLLHSFNQYENLMLKHGLQDWVNECLHQGGKNIEIINWHPGFRDDFKRLNMVWLEKYFAQQIEEKDTLLLSNPQSEVLARGGYMWAATLGEKCVGVCALLPDKDTSYKVEKLAVDEAYQGQGIGLQLMLECIRMARKKGANYLSLETASKLLPALKLYERLGFEQKIPVEGYSVERSDVYMELTFPNGVNNASH